MPANKNITSLPGRRRTEWYLIIILLLMITGYFTVSENVAITRVVKIFLRVSMAGVVFYMYQSLSRITVSSFRHKNTLAPALYMGYLLLGLVSLLWSTKPGYSALQWVMTAESLIFVYFFIKYVRLYNHFHSNDPVVLYRIFGVVIFFILAFFVAGRWVNPDTFFRMTRGGEEARLGGYLMNPNELGMLAVIGLAMTAMDIQKRGLTVVNTIMFLVVLYALIMTGSRSSMIGFLLIMAFFVKGSRHLWLKTSAVVGMVLLIPVMVEMVFIKGGDVEEVLSMTGRLPFWKALITEGLPKEPLLGFGFMRIAYGDTFQSVHTYAGHMTHNTFIQVLMNLGFIGLFLVILQMTFTFRAAIQSKEKENKTFFLALLIPILINSFTEFGIFGETNYGILFWQFLVLLFVLEYEPRLNTFQKVRLKNLGLSA